MTLSKSVAATGITAGLEFNTSQLEALLTITSGSIDADIGDSNNIAWTFDAGSSAFDYLADGEKLVLTYNITATDTTNKTDSQDVIITITGTNDAPVITGDLAATVDEGGTVILTTSDLNFSDSDDTASDVTFTASSLTNGSLTVNGSTNQTTFTGAQLQANQVSFVHDGSETTTASLNINVEDGNEDSSSPVNSAFNLTVNSINDAPTISGDLNATVNSGSSVTLTTTDLNYTDPDDDASGVIFTISSLTNGSITVNGATNQTTFTGAQLAAGQVSFVHDGSASASGTFNVNVEDGNEDSSTPSNSTFNINVDTADPIAGGTTLFLDTFESNSADGWSNDSGDNDELKIESGSTSSKTFNFGSANANKSVTIKYNIKTITIGKAMTFHNHRRKLFTIILQ